MALAILGMLSAVWALQLLLPSRAQMIMEMSLAVSVERAHWALIDPFGRPGWLTLASLVTHAFLHADWEHFAMNMGFGVAFMGAVERRLGGRRLVLVMVVSALVGAVAFLALNWGQPAFVLGASGAIYGAMGALCRALLADHDPRHRRLAVGLGVFLVVSNLLLALVGQRLLVETIGAAIAWEAHLGGFLAGFLLGRPPRRMHAAPA